jgi:hypothetical protein
MNERDYELAAECYVAPSWEFDYKKFADLIRADEREALIKFFEQHWRENWSDGQIVEALEALEARGKT